MGDNIVAVEVLHDFLYPLAVETRGAAARFEVDSEAGCGCVGVLAPRAGDGSTHVGSRVQMLCYSSALKLPMK